MITYSKTQDSQIQKTSQWLPAARGAGGGTSQGYGINRYKLLCINQTSNNDILYSTRNYYLLITFYWYIMYKNTEPLYYTPETNIVNQLYVNKNSVSSTLMIMLIKLLFYFDLLLSLLYKSLFSLFLYFLLYT